MMSAKQRLPENKDVLKVFLKVFEILEWLVWEMKQLTILLHFFGKNRKIYLQRAHVVNTILI